MTGRSWRPLAAPAAFLLAATIAVALARPAVHRDAPPARVQAAQVKTQKAAVADVRQAAKRQPAAGAMYTVRAGDTLGTIAARHHVTVGTLLELNPKAQPTALFIGQQIRLR